jgi:undecaprenyl diphosphate synthase
MLLSSWMVMGVGPSSGAKNALVPVILQVLNGVQRNVVEWQHVLASNILTLYTFSSENWNRPIEEVTALMHLLFDSLRRRIACSKTISASKPSATFPNCPIKLQAKIAKCVDDTRKTARG